jgi:hypothetical protein
MTFVCLAGMLFPTKCHSEVVGTPAVCSGIQIQISAWRPAMLTEVYSGFTQFLQANARAVPEIRPQLLPSMSFTINYSPVIFLLDITWSELPKVTLNKCQINRYKES